MPEYTGPGVYIVESSGFPHSIAQVETAIPAFIGYTEKARLKQEGDLLNRPFRISSLLEYQQYFGEADQERGIVVEVDTQCKPIRISAKNITPSSYLLYYSLQAFFANGGGPCYIVSVGDYKDVLIKKEALLSGLAAVEKEDEVTLLVFPDGTNMTAPSDYYAVVDQALKQCSDLRDRFTVCDVYMHHDPSIDDIGFFRKTITGNRVATRVGTGSQPAGTIDRFTESSRSDYCELRKATTVIQRPGVMR